MLIERTIKCPPWLLKKNEKRQSIYVLHGRLSNHFCVWLSLTGRTSIFVLLLLLCPLFLICQSKASFYYPNDSILIKKQFLKRSYYLHGRELNLHVMKWLMQDVPAAKDKIQLSVWSDQMTIGTYGVGGLASFAGLVVLADNQRLGAKLLKFGGYSIGAGILFQILSANYKRKAVKVYNLSLKQKETTDRFRLEFKGFPDKVELCFRF